MIALQFDLVMEFAILVDLDNAASAGFNNHGQAIVQALKRVNLETFARVSIGIGGIIFPDDFLIRSHFHYSVPALLKENVAIGRTEAS